jgi:hypothetical protein
MEHATAKVAIQVSYVMKRYVRITATHMEPASRIGHVNVLKAGDI